MSKTRTYTYTFVELPVSQRTYDEIKAKLKDTDYGPQIQPDGAIDMHGLALTVDPAAGNKGHEGRLDTFDLGAGYVGITLETAQAMVGRYLGQPTRVYFEG